MRLNTTTDHVDAWFDGHIDDVLNSIAESWNDPEINKRSLIIWLMRLSVAVHDHRENVQYLDGTTDYDRFLEAVEDILANKTRL